MKHIFGPVLSRRLGLSLGIDIIPFKTCTFNCSYCECGTTTVQTSKRKAYIKASTIISELKQFLSDDPQLDYITITGSGEPTLNTELLKIIKSIKKLTKTPVAILTNGCLLHLKKVRNELSHADLVVPSLDAVSTELFSRIDQPLKTFDLKKYLQGFIDFRKEFSGQIWLEVFLIKDLNDSPEEIRKIIQAAKKIRPDKVQLNTLDRPPIDQSIRPLSLNKMTLIANQFKKNNLKVEIAVLKKVSTPSKKQTTDQMEMKILNLVSRRPETLTHMAKAFQIEQTKIGLILKKMIKEKLIKKQKRKGSKEIYYSLFKS
jgi:wyosine [tRNA(Phe)-imidazoG37] synthetase (radical SAM superfamily)